MSQGLLASIVASLNFLGVSKIALFSVECPAEVHFTTIFALRNDKIFEVEGEGRGSSLYPPYVSSLIAMAKFIHRI